MVNASELKPLFIPLKREFFEAFERGTKKCEYRKHGKRWNRETCVPGRPVVLSLGYGKGRRLHGIVTDFNVSMSMAQSDAFIACYGICGPETACSCITIELNANMLPLAAQPKKNDAKE